LQQAKNKIKRQSSVINDRLLAALRHTDAHQHLCSIYEEPEDRFAVVVPYLRIGLERGDKCMYIANDGELDLVRERMASGGIDVERWQSSGALVLRSKEQAYMRYGAFEPQKMFDFWRHCAGEAADEGHAALRTAGETDWVARGGPGLERWMEYESRLTRELLEIPCLALCQYHRRLFSAELVLGVIRTHPTLIYRGTAAPNMYHVPPEDFLREGHTEREVDRLLRDIREREEIVVALREQQQGLRRNTAYLAAGQRLSHTGSWAWSGASGELYWSEEHFRICGIEPGTVRPTVELFFGLVHADDRERMRALFETAVRERGNYEAEYRVVRPDGSVRHVRAQAHPAGRDDGSRPPEYIGTVMDITERRLAEDSLRSAREQLAHVNRALTVVELTASIAHELNQPLAAVVANAGACARWLAAEPSNHAEARAALHRIERDANRASDVMARIRALLMRHPTQKSDLALGQLIGDMVALAEERARAHGVALTTRFGELPTVRGDRVQVEQVLLNLVVNAIDAMRAAPPPRILEVSAGRDATGVFIAVSDSGPGLQAQIIDRVFDPFFSTKREGMGMGLAISRSIVEAHGGRIVGANNATGGATFRFTLPA
jgi:PAS domain S-box-containing protein